MSCYYIRRLNHVPRIFAEFVDDGSLADWIRTRKLYRGGPEHALKRIMDIATQFAWGLDHAHAQGLIHQDVKPSNVLMGRDGIAKVTDFGLARARSLSEFTHGFDAQKSLLVSSGGMTPAYCSPEQARGERLSRKTDMWSWAIGVVEMFFGALFCRHGGHLASRAFATYRRQTNVGLLQVPAQIASLIARCLHEDPLERPKDFSEIVAELNAMYEELCGTEYHRTAPLAATLLVANLNNKAISLADLKRKEGAADLLLRATELDIKNLDVRYNLNLLRWNNAQISDNEFIEALASREVSSPNREGSSLQRGLAHFALGEYERAGKQLLAVPAGNARESIASHYSHLAKQYSPQEKHRVFSSAVKSARSAILISQDSTRMFVLEGDVQSWDIASGRRLASFTMPKESVTSLHLCNDPDVLIGATMASLVFWNIHLGTITRALPTTGRVLKGVFCSSSGRAIVEMAYDDPNAPFSPPHVVIELLDLSSGNVVSDFDHRTYGVHLIGCSKDGRTIVSKSRRGRLPREQTLFAWDAVTSKVFTNFTASTYGVQAAAVFPDRHNALIGFSGGLLRDSQGRALLPADTGGELRLIDFVSGRTYERFGADFGLATRISLSEDGRRALTWSEFLQDGAEYHAVVLWSLPFGTPIRILHRSKRSGSKFCRDVCLSPDGRYAVAGAESGNIHVWDTDAMAPAPYLISQPRSFAQSTAVTSEFSRLLDDARAAFQNGKATQAGFLLRQARSLPGFSGHPEAKLLWSAIGAGLARRGVLDIRQIRLTSPCPPGEFGGFHCLALAESHTCAVAGLFSGAIAVCNYETGELERILNRHQRSVTAIHVTQDGPETHIISGGDDPFLQVTGIDGRQIASLDRQNPFLLEAASDDDEAADLLHRGVPAHVFWDHGVNAITTGIRGTYIAYGSRDGRDRWTEKPARPETPMLGIWHLPDEQIIQLTTLPRTTGVTCVQFVELAGTQYLLSGCNHGLQLWDPITGLLASTLGGGFGEVELLASTPCRRFIAAAHVNGEPTGELLQTRCVSVWDLKEQSMVHCFAQDEDVCSLCFTSDCSFLCILGANKILQIVNLNTGTFCFRMKLDAQHMVATSDWRKLVCCNSDQLMVYEIEWDYRFGSEGAE